MFDKNKFAQILKNINETYNSQRDFSKKSEINRTYLSQYMNMKLDEPPKPKILGKLANSSHGIITYDELMKICGYIDNNSDDSLKSLYNELNVLEEKHSTICDFLNDEEFLIHGDLFKQLLQYLDDEYTTPETFNPNKILDDLDFVSDISKRRLYNSLKNDFSYFYEKRKIQEKIYLLKKRKKANQKINMPIYFIDSNKSLFNIPVLGKITAGQPILAEEYLEGYLPVNPNIYGMTSPDDYFYLKVSGESMNLKVHNGDYALIHKQDYAENGDIIVAIVNGDDEATMKRYKKINDEIIMLEPMSTYPMEPIVINLKETKFQIIGRAIGQFGKF